jgi:predicted DNA-binding ribbon-helix-helix protein
MMGYAFKQSRLVSRNVAVNGLRTSMRLAPEDWRALEEICRRERMTLSALVSRIASTHHGEMLTQAVRTYLLTYFRAAATEEGHKAAGHGVMA